MGLEQFMDGPVLADEKDRAFNENTPDTPPSPQVKPDKVYKEDKCDYSKEVKECQSCTTPSPKVGTNHWECPDDDCGVIEFSMSYNEWHRLGDFLDTTKL